jgi:hypothetical protein
MVTRWLGALAFVATFAALTSAAPARADDAATTAPFRAKLVSNVAVAKKGASSLTSIAKQSPPKNLSADERKAWADQSKALASGAARLNALRLRMDAVLAKAHAPASELAQVNLELGNAQQEIENESQRCAVGNATKARHDAAMKAIR